jgi:hypothetical protein
MVLRRGASSAQDGEAGGPCAPIQAQAQRPARNIDPLEAGVGGTLPPLVHRAVVDEARSRVYSGAVTLEAEELFRAAAALPEIERAALVVRLLDSIASEADVVASHTDESRDRLAAAHAGSLEVLDEEDAWRVITG